MLKGMEGIDPDRLTTLADAIETNADLWRLLTPESIAGGPVGIAAKLRNMAIYFIRRREGSPFGKKIGTFYESWKD